MSGSCVNQSRRLLPAIDLKKFFLENSLFWKLFWRFICNFWRILWRIFWRIFWKFFDEFFEEFFEIFFETFFENSFLNFLKIIWKNFLFWNICCWKLLFEQVSLLIFWGKFYWNFLIFWFFGVTLKFFVQTINMKWFFVRNTAEHKAYHIPALKFSLNFSDKIKAPKRFKK